MRTLAVYLMLYLIFLVVFAMIGFALIGGVFAVESQLVFHGWVGVAILIGSAGAAVAPPTIIRRLELAGRSYRLLEEELSKRESTVPNPQQPSRLTKRASEALGYLGLVEGVTAGEIRRRYRAIIKECHPDQNGGDRSKERRLNRTFQAYKILCADGLA